MEYVILMLNILFAMVPLSLLTSLFFHVHLDLPLLMDIVTAIFIMKLLIAAQLSMELITFRGAVTLGQVFTKMEYFMTHIVHLPTAT